MHEKRSHSMTFQIQATFYNFYIWRFPLTHWGLVTHICVVKLTITCSDNGLSPERRQSHYLNQCCNIVDWTLGNKLQLNFNRNSNIFIEENMFENVVCEMLFISSRPQYVKAILPLAWEPPKIDASEWFYPHLVSSTPVLLTDRFFVF